MDIATPKAPAESPLDTPTTKMLLALNRVLPHIYAGTVPDAVKRRNRAANKVARKSRRVNRLRK